MENPGGNHMELGEKIFWTIMIVVFIFTTGMILVILVNEPLPDCRYECEWDLCKQHGSMEVCFGLPSECELLEFKCTREPSYMEQWNLSCSWLNNTCTCYQEE